MVDIEIAYKNFIESKKVSYIDAGINVEPNEINPLLFDFQRDIVVWALRKGRACIFAGTGLGKTMMQLEWANLVNQRLGVNVLILAPLAVSYQTKDEGEKIGVKVNVCRSMGDVKPGINITNYEMLHNFDTSAFGAVILDESSILKSFTGKVRTDIIEAFRMTPYKLACTATPAPNDYMELGNHSEFIGGMSRTEMLSMFFVHDGGETSKWRLKGHCKEMFWQWVASWAVMISNPGDLGYDGSKFDLPKLNIHEVIVKKTGYAGKKMSLNDRRAARRNSLDERANACAEIINGFDEPSIIWCDLNDESELLTKAINDAVEIRGSHDREYKETVMHGFTDGEVKRLVTKPSIAGFGMNWQHCNKMAFVGLSDSFEEYYQAVRRCWRFGQTRPVDVYIITSEAEGEVVKNIKRKEKEFGEMLKGMISATQEITKENVRNNTEKKETYKTDIKTGDGFTVMLGDSCELVKNIGTESIDYTVFSPPFSQLYVYSNSIRDMGNCKSDGEFMAHFRFLAGELYRIIKPGRLLSFHCMDLPSMKERDGVIGVKDFSGDLIKLFEDVGFIYHSRVTIWKDPVIEMQRTKALGLLHKQLKKDSTMSRCGLPDYLITMRKPGDNLVPIEHTDADYSVDKWQKIASPVWMDINQSNTLQRESARAEEDEKHICPLQLDVIERCIELYTNPGETVYDPFMGIGSSCYQALLMGRKAIGSELKPEYFDQAVANVQRAAFNGKTKQISIMEAVKRQQSILNFN